MHNLSKFSERLSELLFDAKITSNDLADAINAELSEVYRWLRGEYFPHTLTLIKIADYLCCSIDFLLGDDCEPFESKYKPCPPFGDRINALLGEKGITQYQFCKETKISRSRVGDWRRNLRLPVIDNLFIISDYFDMSIDSILGRN